MKRRNNTYREVTRLPTNAVTVQEYCDDKGISDTYVYSLWKAHTGEKKKEISFEIVLFKTMNFVIPKK